MIIAAVQVRMDSTRLKGKTLAEIEGQPMLWHIVNRLRVAAYIDKVVIATSDEASDGPIRAFAKTNDIPYFSGSKTDLIDRLYKTAMNFKADALVRITGDCPLADPKIVDMVVSKYLEPLGSMSLDYVSNILPPTFPDGLDTELYPLATLKRFWKEIRDPFMREWFPVYLKAHRAELNILNVVNPIDLSGLRWTVDYEEDLFFVREVYKCLYHEGKIFDMEDILNLLDKRPDISDINAGHTRNEGYNIAVAVCENKKRLKEN